MTEEEWTRVTDPYQMLVFLRDNLTERKLRLLAVAFCRSILHLVRDEMQKRNLEIAELCADGLLPHGKLKELYDGAELTSFLMGKLPAKWSSEHYALAATGDVVDPDPYDAADNTLWLAEYALRSATQRSGFPEPTGKQEQLLQTVIIRDIVGNPFHVQPVDPHWRTAKVVSFATTIYDDSLFDDLPILADALEDAGCDNSCILSHCRNPSQHVKGCWVVDFLLNKR